MSLEAKHPDALTYEVAKIPLPDTTQGLLSALRRILSKPFIQEIQLHTGSPIVVSWWKDISDSLDMDVPEISPDTVLANIELTEFEGDGLPREVLVDALLALTGEGYYPAFFFVGDVSYVKNWLSIPRVVRLPKVEGSEYLNLMGVRMLEVPSMPTECVVLLGGEVMSAERSEVRRGLKIVT